MRWGRTFGGATLLLVLCAVALPAGDAAGQTAKDMVGSWTLVSSTIAQGDKKVEPFGPSPKGAMMLDADGHFMITLTRGDLPRFAVNNREKGAPEENTAVVRGSIAYFGTYAFSEADGAMTVRIRGGTFPNWDGTEQKRLITLSGDELTYTSTNPSAGGGTARVVWRRSK